MRRRKKKKKGGGRSRKRRWWWTDGRGLEVDGGQLAAGGLRELCQHAGQGPVLSLQPLFNLPQGLNLLYLGEVLQEGEKQQPQHRRTRREEGRGRQREDGGGGGGGERRRDAFQERNEERTGLMKDRTI